MKNIYIFGDSVLKGVTYDETTGRYHLCHDKLGADELCIRNYSKMGATVSYGINAVRKHTEEMTKGDIAVLEYGGNDCNHNWAEVSADPNGCHSAVVEPEEYERELSEAAGEIMHTGAKLIISTLVPICSEKFMNYISKGLSYENILHWLGDVDHISRFQKGYSDIAENVARSFGCECMPLRTAYPEDRMSELICGDGIHPTEDGHKIIHRFMEQYLLAQ